MSILNYISISFIFGVFVAAVFVERLDFGLWALWLLLLWAGLIFSLFRASNIGTKFFLLCLIFYALGLGRGSFKSENPKSWGGVSLKPVQSFITHQLGQNLYEPHRSLAYGIFFGTGGNFDKDFLSSLRKTGTAHMVAASGYNVSIVMGILINTAFLVTSRAFLVLGGLVLFFYLLIVGFSASVVRAAIMVLYLFAAQMFGRQKNLVDALLFSAALMLLINPLSFYDLGFQLSFLAMAAIIFLSPFFEKAFRLLPKTFNQVLSATLATQVIILPVSLFNFGQISLVAPLSNLLTFWVVPPVMALTGIEVLAGLFSPFLGKMAALGNFVLLEYFVFVVRSLAAWKWASVTF